EEEEEEDERVDLAMIQSFASKIQHLPTGEGSSRIKIHIPKRGEKDFEPLAETVNLQEMMLQRSREALFNALVGVRGGSSKAISHAVYDPTSEAPYPKMLITRGHIYDSLGIAVRKGKGKSSVQLLPEESLYLLERGSLQIWVGPEGDDGIGQWDEEFQGVKGAVEMSVMEGYGNFLGREGLTWERYQAYAYLKRLGYTVQRSRRFIPSHFLADPFTRHSNWLNQQNETLPPFRTWWSNLPRWCSLAIRRFFQYSSALTANIAHVGLRLSSSIFPGPRRQFKGTLLQDWLGSTYPSLFSHLRIIPTTHSAPLPLRPTSTAKDSIYSDLKTNPYIPFFHVWKPAVAFSKVRWDRGSAQGLINQPPDFFVAAVEARNTPMPSIHQLKDAWAQVREEPSGPIRRLGPQYENRKPNTRRFQSKEKSRWERFTDWWRGSEPRKYQGGNMGVLRNGDRALVVAVNDSGNTGWVRFGRSGFAE
ncbi:hypothetical protein TREMEDRAFT_14304, partial [Tremella mesenterica DSM 1558]|uniref:uncharacterized protein n=1 Tax=Tremella mesenterica (strain ATCC 24925 / CBS 8224 / DSM 1558 / NBRC 9311 / NRRL Y-6157 / RJB 2259-6 / UBC 559-6) TaxID=578456 RepID=UPI0003F48E00